jgi:exopolysaccharide production protein ExoQ
MLSQSRTDIRPAKRASARALREPDQHTGPTPHGVSFPGRGVLAFLPVVIYFYVLVVLPLNGGDGTPRLENILFWPTLAAVAIGLALYNYSILDRGYFSSPPIAIYLAYMMFAAASIIWAHSPDLAFSRFMVQLFAGIIILLPFALPVDTRRTIQRLHVTAFIAVAINAIFVMTTPPSPIGHPGYFIHKQELGMLCGAAIILAAHELFFRGWRRWLAAPSIFLTFWVIFESQSKASLALLVAATSLAVFILVASKLFRTSPAFVVGGMVLGFEVLSRFWSDPIRRIAWILYGDPTITGRTYIWDFINYQISHRGWFGWGFHSYWNVPDSPHNQAPGFIKDMISSHSGYLELRLETGSIGYWIFLGFVYALLHSIEQVRRKDLIRAWVLLALSMYVVLINLLESVWLQLIPLWMLYLVVVGETVRFSRSERVNRASSETLSTSKNSRELSARRVNAVGERRPR